jgi:hypothetical protein
MGWQTMQLVVNCEKIWTKSKMTNRNQQNEDAPFKAYAFCNHCRLFFSIFVLI